MKHTKVSLSVTVHLQLQQIAVQQIHAKQNNNKLKKKLSRLLASAPPQNNENGGGGGGFVKLIICRNLLTRQR